MSKIVTTYNDLPSIFKVSSLYKVLPKRASRRTIDRHLKKHVQQKMLLKMKRGWYAKVSANQFQVAMEVYRGYIGFSSALYLYGLKNEVEDRVYVCVDKKEKARMLGKVKILPVYLDGMCFGTSFLNEILISTYPKTIFDMLYKPKYANLYDLHRAINLRSFDKDELKELLYYLKQSNISTIRRVGYVLEGIVPVWFIKEIMKLDNKVGKSFFLRKNAINFDKKWHIYDDVNVKRWKNVG